jgi:hypothetical protein
MAIVILDNWYSRPLAVPEVYSGDSIVDDLGYRSVQQQVEAFTLAGLRLDALRATGDYDSDLIGSHEDVEALETPRSRSMDYDFADAYEDLMDLHERLLKRRHEEQLQAEADALAAQKAEQVSTQSTEQAKTTGTPTGPGADPT